MPRPTPHGRKAAKAPGFKPVKKGAKGFKSDGAAKNRWSNEQRAAQGHAPRKPWEKRDDRFEAPREERSFRSDAPRTSDTRGRNFESVQRDDNRGHGNRDDRGGREGGFGGRAPGTHAPSNDRGSNDRGGFNRDDRNSAPRSYGNRDDRGGFNRDDRSSAPRSYGNRDDRGGFNRDDRGFNRDDRGGERRSSSRDDRADRGPRKEFSPARPYHAEPRPRWEPRVDRKPWERAERPQRDDRAPSTERRDDRLPADERSWRDERPARTERPERSGGFDRSERRPAWGRDENRGGFRDERRPQADRREDRPASEDPDQMSWEATDLGELDDSAVQADQGFAALGVPSIIVAALDKQGITTPFPIQQATIPDAIAGRDVLGRGQTGSGKTLGFGLPMLTRIQQSESTGGAPRGLVLVPTRELALQCADVLAPLAKALRLDLTLIAGGMGYGPQLRAFDRGVDIVVATPGRLIDLLEQGAVDLSQVLVTVLDEADHMADLGFMPAVTTLMDTVPADGQRLLFSATLDHAVDRIVKKYLHDPVTHEVDSDHASVSTMEHQLLQVLPHDKNGITAEIANREGRTVVFVRTQLGANRVAEQLRGAGVMAGALHGGLTQGARTRVLAAFKEGTVPVLVATDVAARGIHVDDVSLVLAVDPPMNSKDYLHRAGRTARAGQKGVVASIVLPHQRKAMARLAGQAGVHVEPVAVRPGDDKLAEMTGARPVDRAPIEEAEYERLIAPRRGGGGGARGGRPGGGGYKGNNPRGGGGYRGQGGGGRRFGGGGDRDRGSRGGSEGWRRDR